MDPDFPIQNIIYLVITLFLLRGVFFMVKQKNAYIVERLGKFHKVSKAGLNLKEISLIVQQYRRFSV